MPGKHVVDPLLIQLNMVRDRRFNPVAKIWVTDNFWSCQKNKGTKGQNCLSVLSGTCRKMGNTGGNACRKRVRGAEPNQRELSISDSGEDKSWMLEVS